MKKVAIVTLTGYYNYGNRLQNYALQKTLESLNFEVTTLKIRREEVLKSSNKDRLQIIKNNSIKELIRIIYNKYIVNNSKTNKIRCQNFIDFSTNYINESDFWISENNINESLDNDFDYFIVGSDQVWNPYDLVVSPLYFLTFTSREKKISYAASFGVDSIPEQKIDNYKKWLADFNSISVREKQGKKIVKDLINKDVPLVLDPTLLLSKKEWLDLATDNFEIPKNKYILTYFLSPISKENNKILKNYAKKNNLKIINLSNFKDKKAYTKDPRDFINYINNSTLFCTDSFHGTVFSIILEKPFIVYERTNSKSMYSRIETLLTMFNLQKREIKNINFDNNIYEIDYSFKDIVLDNQKKQSLNYLQEALGNRNKS